MRRGTRHACWTRTCCGASVPGGGNRHCVDGERDTVNNKETHKFKIGRSENQQMDIPVEVYDEHPSVFRWSSSPDYSIISAEKNMTLIR